MYSLFLITVDCCNTLTTRIPLYNELNDIFLSSYFNKPSFKSQRNNKNKFICKNRSEIEASSKLKLPIKKINEFVRTKKTVKALKNELTEYPFDELKKIEGYPYLELGHPHRSKIVSSAKTPIISRITLKPISSEELKKIFDKYNS